MEGDINTQRVPLEMSLRLHKRTNKGLPAPERGMKTRKKSRSRNTARKEAKFESCVSSRASLSSLGPSAVFRSADGPSVTTTLRTKFCICGPSRVGRDFLVHFVDTYIPPT